MATVSDHPIYKDHGNVKFLRGKPDCLLLVYNNFLYKRTGGEYPNTTYRCAKGCSAKVYTTAGIFKKAHPCSLHKHPSQEDKIAVIKAKMTIKRRIQTEFNLTVHQIHTQERNALMRNKSTEAYLRLDSYSSSRINYYKYRQSVFPQAPKHRRDVLLTGDWTLTLNKTEDFLLAADGTDDKILVFGTESNLKILCNAEYIVGDGTFTVHPTIFSQLYILHAPYLCKVLPLVFILLPDKSYNTYCRMLTLISYCEKSRNLNFNPPKVHIDFELAMIKAVYDIFGKNRVVGCLFHFSQCIWRKVQELGFSSSYKTNADVKRWVRRFTALPFLPINDIDDGFLAIQDASPDISNETVSFQQVEKFHDYIVNTWVHDTEAMLRREIWNQFENTGPRTTNNAEGFHSKLNRDGDSHMTLYKFVHFLKELQVDLDINKVQLISSSPSSRKQIYDKIDEKINIAKYNYESGNVEILQYLDAVSGALKLD